MYEILTEQGKVYQSNWKDINAKPTEELEFQFEISILQKNKDSNYVNFKFRGGKSKDNFYEFYEYIKECIL